MTVLQTLQTISPLYLPVHKISVSSQRPQKFSLFAPTCHQLFKCVRLTVKTSYRLHLCNAYQTLVIPFRRYTDEHCASKRNILLFVCRNLLAHQRSGGPICCSLCDSSAFSHGYRANAWQLGKTFEREVIRVISSNGSVHKYRTQIKAN